jgi:hypothetical protein
MNAQAYQQKLNLIKEQNVAKLNLLSVAVIARDMIDRGWTQGTWHRKGYRDGEAVDFVCTEGAVQQSMRLAIANELNMEPLVCQQLNGLSAQERKQMIETMALNLSQPREKKVFQYMCKMLGVGSIPGWNDNRNRTKEEVLRLFDNLINELSERPVDQQTFEYAELRGEL